MPNESENRGCLGFIFRLIGGSPDKNESQSTTERLPYRRKDWLFTKAERSFFGVLEQVVASKFRIFAKVRLSDLLWLPKNCDKRQSHQNRINLKHVDFVLCTVDEVQPILVIELDDSSHDRGDRKERDGFLDSALAAAGIPILHVRAQQAYRVDELAKSIQSRLNVPAGS